jgi:hypothetical protein
MKALGKKLKDWREAQAKLNHYKALEMSLRVELVDIIAKPAPGTYHREINKGVLKATVKRNYKLDTEVLPLIKKNLTPEEKLCIVTKEALSMKYFKKLPPKNNLSKAIIETEATPSLTFKEE